MSDDARAAGARTAVLINPAAGGGRAGRLWRRLLAAAPELDRARLVQGAGPEAARSELAGLLENGADRVLAVGGDGTAHLVAGVLLEAGRGDAVAFGLVPAGTGSDLARSLGLPREPVAALRQALDAAPRAIDAMVIETDRERRFAVNTASAGMSGAVVPAINANPRRGRLSYLTATLGSLARYRPEACRVTVDDEPFHDGELFLAAFANGRFFGNGMPVAPEARLDDGRIDVVVVPPVPRWQLPYRMPQFLTGRHVRLPFVKTHRAERIRVEPAPGFPPYEVDGECLESGPAEIRVLPGALRVLA